MIGEIILLVILIMFNGVFSATEIAFLGIDKYWLKEKAKEENRRAKKIDKLLNDPSIFLSSIQIGITFAGFLASAFAADSFAEYFVHMIETDIIDIETLETIMIVIITIILSYFTLVFGELVPKKIALSNPKKVALAMAYPMHLVTIIFYPLIKLLSWSTNFVCKLFRIKEKPSNELTEEDIKSLIRGGAYEGILENDEKRYLLNIFEFNDTKVSKIMKPIEEAIMIDSSVDLKKLINKIKKSKYTRFPVYENDKNNIIGVLNIKKLLFDLSKKEKFDLKNHLMKPLMINKNEIIDDLFKKLNEEKVGLAIVINDESEVVGIVTLEDIIEEVLGSIADEYN